MIGFFLLALLFNPAELPGRQFHKNKQQAAISLIFEIVRCLQLVDRIEIDQFVKDPDGQI